MPETLFSSGNRRAFCMTTILLAGIFSILVMLPSILQRFDTAYPYQGVHILGPDAEVYYAARVREVYDGFPSLGNTFFSAPKNQPAMQPSLPEFSIATLGRVFGLDALGAFLLSKVLLSFFVFIAFTWFLIIVTGRPWVSLLSTVIALEAGALLAAPWDVPVFLFPNQASLEFLRFSRAINPQWSVTFFLVCTSLIALWIKTGKKLPLFLAALCTGTIVYAYVYAWTYFFCAVGLLSIWYFFRRDWSRVRDLVFFWIVSALVAMPYGFHLLAVTHHPFYHESSMRLGMVLQHRPFIFGVWCAVFIGLALASRTLWPRTWPLLPSLGLAGFVAFNQHLVTGHYIVPHHYNWYFVQPLASIIASAFGVSIVSLLIARRNIRIAGGVLLVVLSIVIATVQQSVAYRGVASYWGDLQAVAPVLEHIAKNLQVGDVVYSQDMDILNLVPVYSSADVYNAENANLTLVSDARSRFAYFFDLWLQGLTPADIAHDFPTTRRFMLSSRLHAIYYREAVGDYAGIPDAEVASNVVSYQDFYTLSLHEKLTEYPMNAVVTTPHDPDNVVWYRFLRCSTEVFSDKGYGVRTMIPMGEKNSCL